MEPDTISTIATILQFFGIVWLLLCARHNFFMEGDIDRDVPTDKLGHGSNKADLTKTGTSVRENL